jgi:hypothetical protein
MVYNKDKLKFMHVLLGIWWASSWTRGDLNLKVPYKLAVVARLLGDLDEAIPSNKVFLSNHIESYAHMLFAFELPFYYFWAKISERSLLTRIHGCARGNLSETTRLALVERDASLFFTTPSVTTTSIMPLQSKGFTAWISIDDTELDAYSIEATNDGKKVTSWIASETGKASGH